MRLLMAAGMALPVVALDGTASGAPSFGISPASAPEVDHLLTFDGIDDVAAASTTVVPTAGGAAFSVELWVLDPTDSDAAYRHAVSQGNGGNAFYIGTAINSQELRIGDTWLSSGVDLPVGRWVHVAVTTPGNGTAKLYIDGRLAASKASGFAGPQNLGANFRFGAQFTGSEFWNGQIDTVRVWGVERSAGDVAASMHAAVDPGATGLIAQYLANEGAGTTVANGATGASSATNMTLSAGASWQSLATITTVGGDTVVSFPRSVITSTGGWTVPAGVGVLDALVVAGGGGGGAWVGGGGGAGGVLESAGVAVTAGSTLAVTVGVGGRGAVKSATGFTSGTSGQNSAFGAGLTAIGGGVGASWTDQLAASGGSGGGAARTDQGTAVGTSGQGSAGGIAFADAQPHPTGGGGGAGAVGQTGQSSTVSGAGGAGRASSITGSTVTYGGGGGGSSHGEWTGSNLDAQRTAGAGGAGGGGAGGAPVVSVSTVSGGDGTNGLGGGGGGAANNCGSPCQASIGGDGGTGVVVVRYAALASLAVRTQPQGGAPGGALAVQPAVELRDSTGAVITRDSSTTVTVSASSGATLSGTTTVTAVSGVATFSNLTVDAAEGADVTLSFETSLVGGLTVTSSALRVGLLRDDLTAGGGWVLMGYGANGILGGYLNTHSGAYDPDTRTGRSTIDAVDRFRAAHEVAFSWNRTGYPTGGLDSYEHAVSFVLPNPTSMTLTGLGTPSTPVTITELVGTFNLAVTQYVQPLTLGAAYNGSYGFTNDSVDWGPDGQARQAVYLDHAGASSQPYAEAYTTINGTNTGYVPSTMAVWVRAAAETASAVEVVVPAIAATSGSALTTQPLLRLATAAGGTVSANSVLTATITTPVGVTLSGTTTVTASAGVFTFSGLSLAGPEGPHTLTFTVPGLAPVTQTVTIAAIPVVVAPTPVSPNVPLPLTTLPVVTPVATPSTTVPPTSTPTTTTPGTSPSEPQDPPPAEPVTGADGLVPDLAPGFVQARDDGGPVQVELSRVAPDTWRIDGTGFRLEFQVASLAGDPSPTPIDAGALTLQVSTQARIAGSGFVAGGLVDVWVFSEPRLLARLPVGDDGTVDGLVTVPADLAVGEHTLQVNGVASDGRQRSVSLGIQVIAALADADSGRVLPSTGESRSGYLIVLGLGAIGLGLAALGSGGRRRSQVW